MAFMLLCVKKKLTFASIHLMILLLWLSETSTVSASEILSLLVDLWGGISLQGFSTLFVSEALFPLSLTFSKISIVNSFQSFNSLELFEHLFFVYCLPTVDFKQDKVGEFQS